MKRKGGVEYFLMKEFIDKVLQENQVVGYKQMGIDERIRQLEMLNIDDYDVSDLANQVSTHPVVIKSADFVGIDPYTLAHEGLKKIRGGMTRTLGFRGYGGYHPVSTGYMLASGNHRISKDIIYPSKSNHADSVNSTYLASFVSPIDFCERRPTRTPLRSAIATGSY